VGGIPAAAVSAIYDQTAAASRARFASSPALGFFGAPSGSASKLAHVGIDLVDASANIDSNRVITNSVAANAINNGSAVASAAISLSTTEVVVVSLTLSTNGGVCEIFGGGTAAVNTAGAQATCRIRKDSLTGLQLQVFNYIPAGTSQGSAIPTLLAIDSTPAASQTYVLTMVLSTGTGTGFANILVGDRKR
jgi:hypothetical protein